MPRRTPNYLISNFGISSIIIFSKYNKINCVLFRYKNHLNIYFPKLFLIYFFFFINICALISQISSMISEVFQGRLKANFMRINDFLIHSWLIWIYWSKFCWLRVTTRTLSVATWNFKFWKVEIFGKINLSYLSSYILECLMSIW